MLVNMRKQKVWLSYDLGVQGDYEGLYEWLGEWGAEECGDSLAVFSYSYKTDLAGELLKDIKQDVTLQRARLYLIYRDDATKKLKGRFIQGGRRRPAWAEYAQQSIDDVEDVLFSEAPKPRRRRAG